MLCEHQATVAGVDPWRGWSAWWIHADCPDEGERARLRQLGVPAQLLGDALDPDELPRSCESGDTRFVSLRVLSDGRRGGSRRATTTFAFLLRADALLTVATRPTHVLDRLAGSPAGAPEGAGRVVVAVIQAVAGEYLREIVRIDDDIERLERQLRRSQRNCEVIGLLDLQRRLVRLVHALEGNRDVVRGLVDDAVPELGAVGDALSRAAVEIEQALEMARVTEQMLDQTMDAFTSVISNNLNVVMKFLAALTIVLTIPTIVGGMWGMNVPVPWADQRWAFAALNAGTIAVCVAIALWFRGRGWW
ncbi:MAG: magnesium transporter CorA family protein [Deltaproteobacteria bacterium]|nr:magnesium transporter CorA family protein [Deltaproteobacteria bacterium]MBK8716206.1 magnesium transporter CorA family protein [Deltaproteobacteria bacterium]MBP7289433.1 magnesium transporter CorA family protein [Nannocystaceae bacterium]